MVLFVPAESAESGVGSSHEFLVVICHVRKEVVQAGGANPCSRTPACGVLGGGAGRVTRCFSTGSSASHDACECESSRVCETYFTLACANLFRSITLVSFSFWSTTLVSITLVSTTLVSFLFWSTTLVSFLFWSTTLVSTALVSTASVSFRS